MTFNSIRFKASVLYSTILCAILVAFGAYLFHVTSKGLYMEEDNELQARAEQFTGILNAYGEVAKGHLPPMSLMRRFLSNRSFLTPETEALDKLWERARWNLASQKSLFRVTTMERDVVLQSENMPAAANQAFDQHRSRELMPFSVHFDTILLGKERMRVITMPFTFIQRQPLVLQLAAPLGPIEALLARLRFSIILGVIIILTLSFFIGSFLVAKILDPVTKITRIANRISQQSLGLRITGQPPDEEMLALVNSFNRMIERLERSFTHINEFSSHVAHELKTPLAIIKGELELALLRSDLAPEERRIMMITFQEINRLIKIINDLLLLAKFEYNMDVFKKEPMDFLEFIRDIHSHSSILAAEKEIGMELLIPEGSVRISGDIVHLRRLFFNLLHNAVKFTPTGGSVVIKMEVADGKVTVSVADTGSGIAPQHQAKIFEKFYKAPQSLKKETQGTGLGLCLARSIARAHGGDISFHSELGKGTTFFVTLPLA